MSAIVVGDGFKRDIGASIDEVAFGAVTIAHPESVFGGLGLAGGRYFPPASAFPGR